MYVAVTRACKLLYLTYATSRMSFGTTNYNAPSRFIEEIPSELVDASSVGSKDYSGFGHDKRGDRHGVSAHGAPRYLGGSDIFGGYDPARDKDLGRVYGAGGASAKKKKGAETGSQGSQHRGAQENAGQDLPGHGRETEFSCRLSKQPG